MAHNAVTAKMLVMAPFTAANLLTNVETCYEVEQQLASKPTRSESDVPDHLFFLDWKRETHAAVQATNCLSVTDKGRLRSGLTCSRWLKAPILQLSPMMLSLMTVGPSMRTHLTSTAVTVR